MDKRISGRRKLRSSTGASSSRSVASRKRKAPVQLAKKTYVCLGCNQSFDCFNRPQQFIRSHHFGPNAQDKCKESLHCCIRCDYKALHEHDLNTHYGAKSNRECCIANNSNILTLNRVDTANASGMNIGYGSSNNDDVVHTQTFQPFVSNNDYNMHASRGSDNDQSASFDCDEIVGNDPKTKTSLYLKSSMNNYNSSSEDDIECSSSDDEIIQYIQHADCFPEVSTSKTSNDTNDVSLRSNNVNLKEQDDAPTNSLNSLLDMKEIMDNNEKSMSKNQWFVAGVELENILTNSNVPLHVTDKLFSWAIKHKDNLPSRMSSELKREKIYKQAALQMYGELDDKMRPQHHHIVLPSGRRVSIVKFDVRAQIFSILDCPYIDGSDLQHLIFDNNSNDNPFDVLLKEGERIKGVYNDIETSVWYQETLRKLNLNPEESIVVPIILFLDATQIGGLSSHSLEPLMMTLGILKRTLRNDPRAWKTVGYVEEMSRILGNSKLTPAEKLEDYHFILKLLMQDIKDLITSGPVEWVFIDRISGKQYRRKMIFRLMMIIGDTKGADGWVGRYGSHWNTVGLARDCTMHTRFADDPDHHCNFLYFDDIEKMSANELANISMRKIVHNAFREPADLFGASPYGICTATPPEPLHAVLLGIMVRLFQFFDANLTEKHWKILMEEIPFIVCCIGKQSCVSEYPDCRKFKTGNLGQGHLSGKQKYARIVLIYIAMCRTSVFESFLHTYGKTPKLSKGKSSKNEKKVGKDCEQEEDESDEESVEDISVASGFRSADSDDDNVYSHLVNGGVACDVEDIAPQPKKIFFSLEQYNKLLLVLEETIALYEWLMKPDGHPKKDFDGGRDSPIALRLREFMKMYKKNAPRLVGMGLKLYKFHIIKKWYFYIALFGSPLNFDGSRPESGHKIHAKMTGNRTQKRAETINFQTAMRYYEKNLIERTAMACNIYLHRAKIDREDKAEASFLSSDEEMDDTDNNILICTGRGPFFKVEFSFSEDGKTCSPTVVWIHSTTLKVNKKSKKTTFCDKLMNALVDKLRYYNGSVGGRRIKSIIGCCEATISRESDSSKLFKIRADPCYRLGSAKNDYVKIMWDGEGILPACLMMMIDYSTCKFDTPPDISKLNAEVAATLMVMSEEKFGMHAIVQSTTRNLPEVDGKDRALPRTISSQLTEHLFMEENNRGCKQYQMLPCKRILAKVLAVPDTFDKAGNLESILVFEHISQWHSIFYKYNDQKDNLDEDEVDNSDNDINSFCWESIE